MFKFSNHSKAKMNELKEDRDERTPLLLNSTAIGRQQRKNHLSLCFTLTAAVAVSLCLFLMVAAPLYRTHHRPLHVSVHRHRGNDKKTSEPLNAGSETSVVGKSNDGSKMVCGNYTFRNTAPFDSVLWPLPECFDALFYLWRKDVEGFRQFTRGNIPLGFKASDSTIYIVHGWSPDENSDYLFNIKDALLKLKEEINIITVDWNEGSRAIYYPQASSNVRTTGALIATLNERLSPSYSYCIGHSLGAHVCAHAGKQGAKFDRITGLDPAGPMFTLDGCSELASLCRLHPTDARQVDVIHTDAGVAGTLLPLGRIDFYPNGGKDQPGCSDSTCNHQRSTDYFEQSILHPCFQTSSKCKDAENIPGSCDIECSSRHCPQMGYWTRFGKGQYTLNTTAREPFCKHGDFLMRFTGYIQEETV